MAPRVPEGGAEGAARARARDGEGGAREEGRREPGRDPARRVVRPRRRSSEPQVARVAVADHAVEGVERLVGEEPRQAEEHVPEERRDHPVREVLGERFDGCAGDAGAVEARRVAPDDVGDRRPPLGEAGIEAPRHLAHVVAKAPVRDEDARRRRFDDRARGGGGGGREGVDERARAGRREDRQGDHQAPADGPVRVGRRGVVEPRLERLDPLAEHRDGVRNAPVEGGRVADHRVDREGRQGEGEGVEHGQVPAAARAWARAGRWYRAEWRGFTKPPEPLPSRGTTPS